MIAKLRGIIDTIGDDYCIVDVNGVGYLVFASAKTLGKLTRGKQYCLLTETVVREDSISLFGFYDAWEKEWFLTLTKVQGVGAKVCLSILSVLSPSQLAQAVAAQDKNSFTRASGVGPKLAAMKWMSYLMPVMFLFILNDYPSGLNYYYFISTLISVVTTIIMRKMTNEEALLAQLEANKKDPKKMKKTGFAARLEAMQKQQEQMMKEKQNRK